MVVTKFFISSKGDIDIIVNEFLEEEKISRMDLISVQYQAVDTIDNVFLVYEKRKTQD